MRIGQDASAAVDVLPCQADGRFLVLGDGDGGDDAAAALAQGDDAATLAGLVLGLPGVLPLRLPVLLPAVAADVAAVDLHCAVQHKLAPFRGDGLAELAHEHEGGLPLHPSWRVSSSAASFFTAFAARAMAPSIWRNESLCEAKMLFEVTVKSPRQAEQRKRRRGGLVELGLEYAAAGAVVRLAVLRPAGAAELRVGGVLVHPQHADDGQRAGCGGEQEVLRHGSAPPPSRDGAGWTVFSSLAVWCSRRSGWQ